MATPAASRKTPGGRASYRRARALVIEWAGSDVRFRNFLSGTELQMPSQLGSSIVRLPESLDERACRRAFASTESAGRILQALLEAKIYLRAGSAEEASDARWAREWRWGVDAGLYHFATRHVQFLEPAQERRSLQTLARRSSPPSPYKRVGAPLVKLPAPQAPGDVPLTQALSRRRTVRAFSRRALSLQELSTLLAWTWGKTAEGRDPVLGSFLQKTSPSAGARHPTEVYAAVSRVSGLQPAVYHYDVRSHGLRAVGRRATARELVHAIGDQPWVASAAVTFIMCAMVPRTAWKYGHAHAYRVLYLDAGHLGQTFHLMATAMGLAPFTSAALHVDAVERLVGIDGIRETPIYAASVGHLLRTEPGTARPPRRGPRRSAAR